MYLLYVDESGTNKDDRYFVVGGLAVFERQTFFLKERLDDLQAHYFPMWPEPIEFHASHLRAPDAHAKPPFSLLSREERQTLMDEVYRTIATSRARLFAAVIDKQFVREPPYERGFEEIVSRFDLMLKRVYQQENDAQRGLVVVAESGYRENIESLARKVWSTGHRWGELRNMADVPFFAPAKHTRMLQLADFVVNAVFGRYERGYTRQFDTIATRFDAERGAIHGLTHLSSEQVRAECFCPACLTARMSKQFADDDMRHTSHSIGEDTPADYVPESGAELLP